MGPPLLEKMALLISWRILPSTPARVDSRDCWAPLVANMASMLAGVGGAARVVVVKNERMSSKKSFMDIFFRMVVLVIL